MGEGMPSPTHLQGQHATHARHVAQGFTSVRGINR